LSTSTFSRQFCPSCSDVLYCCMLFICLTTFNEIYNWSYDEQWIVVTNESVNVEGFLVVSFLFGPRGSVDGWGSILKAGKSRVRVPMRSLNYFQFT
jgi:hypothetical protein